MKNVTLSADEAAIARARRVAQLQNKTLNQAFREWLTAYGQPAFTAGQLDEMIGKLSYMRGGRKFTRDEMNER